MKSCPKCGHQLANPNAKFCDKCGALIKRTTTLRRRKSNNYIKIILPLVILVLIVIIGAAVYLFTSGSMQKVSTEQPSSTNKNFKKQSHSDHKPSTTEKKDSQQDDEDENEVWNESKSSKLANFMSTWGSDMNQDYDSYDPNNEDNFMGFKFPDVFTKGNVRVNGSPVSIGWSADGKGVNEYNVVAIYSDLDSDRNKVPMGGAPHLYLFTIHDGNPVVLITQQTQGNEENAIYFKPTANQDVSGQFANIVNNNKMNY